MHSQSGRALSSVGSEHLVYTEGVGGSNPSAPTKDSQEWLSFFVLMHFVYILYTPSKDRYYVGESAFVSGRLDQHNEGFYKGAATKLASDWELFLEIECSDRSQALKIERFIKKNRKERNWILV